MLTNFFLLTNGISQRDKHDCQDDAEPPTPVLEVREVAEQQDDQVEGQPVHQVPETPVDWPPLWKPVDLLHEELVDVVLK